MFMLGFFNCIMLTYAFLDFVFNHFMWCLCFFFLTGADAEYLRIVYNCLLIDMQTDLLSYEF